MICTSAISGSCYLLVANMTFIYRIMSDNGRYAGFRVHDLRKAVSVCLFVRLCFNQAENQLFYYSGYNAF